MLYSFGFAPLVFSSLPMDQAGKLLRRAFPFYYLFVISIGVIAALSFLPNDFLSAGLLAATAGLAVLARQILTPVIIFFKDNDEQRNFNRAHYFSVALNIGQLITVAAVLVRMA